MQTSGVPAVHNLNDYMLLGKLMTGLCDGNLKKEVYRACDTFTVDSLKRFCTAYNASTDYDSNSVTAAAGEPSAAERDVTDNDGFNPAAARHTSTKP